MQDANKKTGEIYILRYVCFSVELKTRQTRNDSYFAMYETLKSIKDTRTCSKHTLGST